MQILKAGKVKTVQMTCPKCKGVFLFEEKDGTRYATDYADSTQGYVVITCPTEKCKNIFYPNFEDFE